jgi:hypothetical protein
MLRRSMLLIRKLIFATSARFLPLVATLMIATLLVEPILRHHSVLRFLRAVYVPMAIGEPLLMSIGFVAGLFTVESRLTSSTLFNIGRHILAAAVALVVLLVASIFSQGAHPPFIILLCVAVGFVSALAAFSFQLLRPIPPSATSA